MGSAYCLGAGQVGDGAGDAEHAGVASGGELHRFGGLEEEFGAGFVGGGEGFEGLAVEFGVGAVGGVG